MVWHGSVRGDNPNINPGCGFPLYFQILTKTYGIIPAYVYTIYGLILPYLHDPYNNYELSNYKTLEQLYNQGELNFDYTDISTGQFQNYKKFMSNQTTVTTPAPQTTPTPKPATPPPTGVNAPPRPAGDTGATPKPLAPAASTPATTNPPAATQAPKPPQQQMLPPAPGKTLGTGGRTAAISPQQQTVPPATGKVRKPRSGRNH